MDNDPFNDNSSDKYYTYMFVAGVVIITMYFLINKYWIL